MLKMCLCKGRKNLKEHFPHQNWPILIVLLQIIRYTSYVMFTPSIYQFVTAARANIDELGNNENSTHFWSGLGGTETDYAWVIISSSACETVLIPVAVFILDILPFTAPLLLLMLMYAVGGALYASATEVWMAMLARGMMGGAGLFVSAVLHSYIGEMGTMMDKIRKKKGKRPLKNVLYMAVIFSINGANVLVLGVYVVFTRISSLNPYRSPGWFLTSLAILSVIIILLLYTEPRPWTCRKKCSRCSCKTGLGFSLKLRSKPKTQVMLIVFVFVCAYVNGQTLSVAFTLVAPILSDQFGFSVANSSLYFVALAVGCLTSCIIQLLVMVLKGNTRIVVGVGLTLCLVGCALLSDWQAIKDDENVCPSFNSSAYQCGDFILGEKETNNQTEHALHPCWQKGYEAQSSSDHLCFWNPQSRVTGECCTTCREACLSHQTSLNFYQFNVGVILVAVGSRIVYVFHLALVSDFVSVESQGIILTLAIGCGALSRVITPLWFVESYELTGKHTYLPMSITIGCLLVLLLALAALYKDLGPRSNQREIKAAISATFKLGISQELSSEKNEPAPITENGDAYKEGKEKREKEEAASVTEVGDQNEIDAYDNNSEPDDSQSAYYHLHYVWCETEM